jgi:hypothetical protein
VEVPMLTHASKNWKVNPSAKMKIASTEMRSLRQVAEYTVLDQKRKTVIRSELKTLILTERIEMLKRKVVGTYFKNDNR